MQGIDGHEHRFLSEFQPIGFKSNLFGLITEAVFNWATLFGVACTVGYGFRLGLGL